MAMQIGYTLQVFRGIRLRGAVVGQILDKLSGFLEAFEELLGLPVHGRLLALRRCNCRAQPGGGRPHVRAPKMR
jgi:hypothetical protein